MTSAGAVVQGTINGCLRGAYIRPPRALDQHINTLNPNGQIGQANEELLQNLFEDEGTQVRNTRIVSLCSLILSTRGVLIALSRPI